jgi:hypothetical protein
LELQDVLPVNLRWIGRDRLAVMGYDLDNLIAELDVLLASYQRVGSDVGRGCWGLIHNLLKPKIFKQKPSKLRAWYCVSMSTNSGSEGIR